jgi:hypothetical protein
MSAPLPAESGPDALAAAQVVVDELSARYTTDQTLTPAERSNLAYDLEDAARRLNSLKREQQ